MIIAAAIIWYHQNDKSNNPYTIADPITTFIFSILVILTTFKLSKQSLRMLIQAVPYHIKLNEVKYTIQSINPNQIVKIYDLHIWSLSMNRIILSVKLDISHAERHGHATEQTEEQQQQEEVKHDQKDIK